MTEISGWPIAGTVIVYMILTYLIIFLYKKHNPIIVQFRKSLSQFAYPKPRWGMVIPLYRNAKEACNCIEHLIKHVGISRLDIIAIDDFSNDTGQTIMAVRELGVEVLQISEQEKDIRKVRAQRRGVQEWINRGREYVICLDSDCFFQSSLLDLELAVAEMAVLDLDGMTGRILPRLGEKPNFLERLQKIEYKFAMRISKGALYAVKSVVIDHPQTIVDLRTKYELSQVSQIVLPGAFGIFRAEIFANTLDEMKPYGGGEDVEITHRLLSKGAKLAYNDELIIETIVPRRFKEWFHQRYLWAQYGTSYLFDSGYINSIFRINKLDLGRYLLMVQILLDLIHPIRLLSFPFFVLDTDLFLVSLICYFLMSLYSSLIIKQPDEQVDWLAELAMPFYQVIHLIGPYTLGYAKQVGRVLYRGVFNKPRRSLLKKSAKV